MDENPSTGEITGILTRIVAGDPDAHDELMPKVYRELRRMAGHYLARERADHTLQPTELVDEAYLRLLGGRQIEWKDRAHFLAVAAQAMRRVLIDHARAKGRQKRGGDARHVPITQIPTQIGEEPVDLLDLETALTTLAQVEPRKAQVVELMFFGGMTAEEIAAVIGVTSRTVDRDWRYARVWLYDRLKDEDSAASRDAGLEA